MGYNMGIFGGSQRSSIGINILISQLLSWLTSTISTNTISLKICHYALNFGFEINTADYGDEK